MTSFEGLTGGMNMLRANSTTLQKSGVKNLKEIKKKKEKGMVFINTAIISKH